MFRIFTAIIFSITMFCNSALAAERLPVITADSAIVIEASTGRVIFEKAADVERQPASMTKMMTCILGLENLMPEEEIKISASAAAADYPELDLQAGDILSAQELLRGMMLVSDNGGAIAVAQAVSGDVAAFSDYMNNKAYELGCRHTNFVNPNGLPDDRHISTARDMATIAAYCMKNPDFRDIVATQRETIHWVHPSDLTVKVENSNKLLGKYKGANGVKTGWTRAAGGCLAASAKRGEIELIVVIMHATDWDTRFNDAKILLDYGFKRISTIYEIDKNRVEKQVFVRGGEQATLDVGPAEDLTFPLFDDENEENFSVAYDLPRFVDAEISTGDVVGSAILKYDGKAVASVPIVARENVNAGFSLMSKIISFTEPLIAVAQDFFPFLA